MPWAPCIAALALALLVAPARAAPVDAPPPPLEALDDAPSVAPPDEAPLRVTPAPDPPTDDEPGLAVPIGAATGCAAGGLLPALGVGAGSAIAGYGIFVGQEQGGIGGCAAVILGLVVGLAILLPSAVALGPCASLAATVGAGFGALVGDRPLWPAVVGALPGVLVGAVGSALVIGGALAASSETDEATRTAGYVSMVGGIVMAVLAGPAAIGGAVLADRTLGEDAAP